MTTPISDGPDDQLTRALSATEGLVAAVRDDQWAAPTGCPGWNVRDLLNHLVLSLIHISEPTRPY